MNIEKCVEPPAIGGMLIAYEDHIAQVKRAVAVALSEIDQVQRLAEEAVAEQMRAACIAAVEQVDGGEAVLVFREHVLAALREVQP